eukprot:TRINITY_DN12531_c7_g1_i5.p1 TRINITY_DN12531_c7_g1~~TRINITY_DN12531_c7_g1_i5.p1  ORF type:complete len:651 (+),score=186.43 TRINITY_DN12531_c7_g1_i5:126-2078(+)
MSDYNNWQQKVGGASGSGFNVGAAEFVPNFAAPAFVPGQTWTPAPAEPAQAESEDVAEDWEAAEDEATTEPALASEAENEPTEVEKAAAAAAAQAEAEAEAEAKPEPAEEAGVENKKEAVAASAATTAEEGESKAAEPEAEDDDDEDEDDADDDVPGDGREHLNIVFIGHVDAGKSTIGGHLMYLTGNVDKRTLEKYEREAREKNRESWYLSWAMDTNDEERAKGKTVECGQGHFTTENKHFTVIDAPGHKSFVPNMISGAAQADVAVLVISARKGEFETGFERGGQTREHAMLVKTAGVKHLIVVINKMDDSTVGWDENRYEECKQKLKPFLRQTGFKPDEVFFMPVSGQVGINLTEKPPAGTCDWYTGPPLVPYLDSLPKIVRLLDHPFRMPVTDKYRDMGTIVMGKVQSGRIRKGQTTYMFPNKDKVCGTRWVEWNLVLSHGSIRLELAPCRSSYDRIVQVSFPFSSSPPFSHLCQLNLPSLHINQVSVDTIWVDDEESDVARSGDNVKLKLKGVEEEAVQPGYVLCPRSKPCHVCTTFDAQLVVLEWKSIICPGFNAVLHIHSATEEVILKTLICHISKKTGKPDKEKGRPRFVKQGDVCIARLQCSGAVCMETFKDHPHMGRFTLRDEGKTLAIGKVLKLKDPRE